jgi:hypothetical protein
MNKRNTVSEERNSSDESSTGMEFTSPSVTKKNIPERMNSP